MLPGTACLPEKSWRSWIRTTPTRFKASCPAARPTAIINLQMAGGFFEPRLRKTPRKELRVLPLDQPPISNLQAGGRGFEPRLRSPELRVLPLDQPPKKKPGCLWASRSSLREKRACSLYLPDSSTCPQPFLVWVRWTCCWKKKLFMSYILGHFSIFVNFFRCVFILGRKPHPQPLPVFRGGEKEKLWIFCPKRAKYP